MERPLHAYEYVEIPFEAATAALAEHGKDLLGDATTAAAGHADELHADLALGVAGFEVGREVTVHLGPVERTEDHKAEATIAWEASSATALFPSLSGTLALTRLREDPPLVQVALLSSYRPPLGALGAAGDALAGRHVAEAAVHRFVRDLAARLEDVAR